MLLTEFHPVYLSLDVREDVAIARFTLAQLNDEENIELVGHELFALVDQCDCRKIVMDLNGVEFVTSSVVGKMITLHRKLHRHQGTLVLCALGETVARVLKTSKLFDYFTVVDDLDAALAVIQ